MRVYVRPRLAAAASRLIMGPWAAQNAGGHAGGSSGNCGRQFYAEGRVLGRDAGQPDAAQLSAAPLHARQVSEAPSWYAAWTEPAFKSAARPYRPSDDPRTSLGTKRLVATQKNVPRWMSKRLR